MGNWGWICGSHVTLAIISWIIGFGSLFFWERVVFRKFRLAKKTPSSHYFPYYIYLLYLITGLVGQLRLESTRENFSWLGYSSGLYWSLHNSHFHRILSPWLCNRNFSAEVNKKYRRKCHENYLFIWTFGNGSPDKNFILIRVFWDGLEFKLRIYPQSMVGHFFWIFISYDCIHGFAFAEGR